MLVLAACPCLPLQTPEIQRISLDQLCLQAQSLLQEQDLSILRKARAKAASRGRKPSEQESDARSVSKGESGASLAGSQEESAKQLLSLPGCLPTAKFLLFSMLSSPSTEAVVAALTSLMRIEALDMHNGCMTNMGKYLCRVPADARIAKVSFAFFWIAALLSSSNMVGAV